MPRWVLYDLLLVGSCGYGVWKGGPPERIAAVTFLLATLLTVLAAGERIQPFMQFELGVMVVDVLVLAVMLVLALVSERFWPIWMAAMASIAVLVHVSVLLRFELMAWAYWRSEALWSYPMLLLLIAATWRHRWRLKQFGTDPSWRRSFSR